MNESKKRLIAILSLSMANSLVGTGISPALSSISQYFSDASPVLIQMVVSLPSLMVLLVSAVFSPISNRVSMRNLCVLSLALFTAGGVLGCVANSVYMLIFTRVLIGLGYGMMLPMSVGLLSYFYERDEQQRLNGYIVILSSVSSIAAMVLVGYLASLSWRACFLVYLFGLPCLWYTWRYIPSVTLNSPKNKISLPLIKKIWPYALGLFSIMIIYFSLLNNCSQIVIAEGTVSSGAVGVVMSIQTVASLLTGVFLDPLKRRLGKWTKYVIWGLALLSALALCVPRSLVCLVTGLVAFGIALAMAVGLFNSAACMVCHKEESLSTTSVMSFTRCLGQFSSPILLAGLQGLMGITNIRFSYFAGAVLAAIMLVIFIPVYMPDKQ